MIVALVGVDPGTARALGAIFDGVEHRLAWSAKTGAQALRSLQREPVDVLLVSTRVSDLTAAELTRQALAQIPCSVILVADTAGADLSAVYDAMGAGAQDVVSAPHLDDRGRVMGGEPLLAKLRVAARLRGSSAKIPAVSGQFALSSPVPLVAIGASTGGPQALFTILSTLPRPFAGAILIVQHVDSEFSQGLAAWLEGGTGVRVRLAQDGGAPEAGTALLASSQDHLVVTAGGTLRYRAEPRELLHRPSVDVLFASLAEHWSKPAVAVLLTGMGRDGAEGMKKLRTQGWYTIAQDQVSSVVYGMPKAAVQLGAVCKVLPLGQIANEIAQRVQPRGGG